MDKSLQVGLRGLVELLSRHLYSSPRIYVRELLQNAVDAITARRLHDDEHAVERHHPDTIVVRADGRSIVFEDNGIGLSHTEVEELLATIGRTSKRDALDLARHDFLGQFGIGLLSGFLVADRIVVKTRSAAVDGAPGVMWTGRSDGTYVVEALAPGDGPMAGAQVIIEPRPEAKEWVEPGRARQLVDEFGRHLPYDLRFEGPGVDAVLTQSPAPWELAAHLPSTQRDLEAVCRDEFGFDPLAVIPFDVPIAGLQGVAFVLPTAVSPATRQTHRVYLKGMLLGSNVNDLLPEWAFFCRCIVNATELRPTASREAIYDDGLLGEVRDELGRQIWEWLAQLAATEPGRLGQFILLHHLAVRALVVADPSLLEAVLPWLPFETSLGDMTMAEFLRARSLVHFTRTVDGYRQVASVVAAQGFAVVNGGYTFDSEILELLPTIRNGIVVEELDSDTLTAQLSPLATEDEVRLSPFLDWARLAVNGLGCDVMLRAFEPVTMPALYVDSREAAHERARAAEEQAADDAWADILSSLRTERARACLVLNHDNPIVRRIETMDDADLVATALEVLYGNALVSGRRQLTPNDAAVLNRSLLALLDAATRTR